ncbi:MAG: polysaccharide biosynthesis protein [Nitrospiraceae bacterium]|nr:polysaccharide biosynthesis protein [Nitrospiraceae bacterium]
MGFFKGKRILVTGACGTIGTELISQILENENDSPEEIIGLDNNESALFFLDERYRLDSRTHFYVADIQDLQDLRSKMRGIDFVFHTAAFKHVILCERSPEQAVNTNISGIQNVITAASVNFVGRVIFTSSDKAVNPTNVMGTSKLMGERLMTAANSNRRGDGTIFASTRFGNVLGSRGSVIPIFRNQIAKGGPVTLTDAMMTRFVMSIGDAVKLVIDSAKIACGGEVFVTKMPVIRIADLARLMIGELAPRYGRDPDEIGIIEIGSKPGEKLYEELMSPEETRRAVELRDYFVVLPAFRGVYHEIDYGNCPGLVSSVVGNPYVSATEKPLSVEELRVFLKQSGLLETAEEEEVLDARGIYGVTRKGAL